MVDRPLNAYVCGVRKASTAQLLLARHFDELRDPRRHAAALQAIDDLSIVRVGSMFIFDDGSPLDIAPGYPASGCVRAGGAGEVSHERVQRFLRQAVPVVQRPWEATAPGVLMPDPAAVAPGAARVSGHAAADDEVTTISHPRLEAGTLEPQRPAAVPGALSVAWARVMAHFGGSKPEPADTAALRHRPGAR